MAALWLYPQLVVKVHMNDNSTKSLMVDERQLARDILDNLFEKTHCDCSVDWCLYEIYPELQLGKSPKSLGLLYYGFLSIQKSLVESHQDFRVITSLLPDSIPVSSFLSEEEMKRQNCSRWQTLGK